MFVFQNRDCMEAMAEFPDKFFELAIADPPYGIKIETSGTRFKQFKTKGWDNSTPSKGYFDELKRVSQNQIIWGGNYFGLGRTRGFIIWDKENDGRDFSESEFAWTSFECPSRIFRYRFIGNKDTEHPTEKPIALYKWLLTKYAKPGDKILDTHVGSASSIIACLDLGFDVWGYELDKDYYRDASKRIADFQAQLKIF